MMKKKQMLILWGPVAGWCTLIFWLSSIPSLSTNLEGWDFILRKIAHSTEYFILTLLVFRAAFRTSACSVAEALWAAAIFSFFYAVSDEVHQFFVPTRCASLFDIGVDATGIIVFIILVHRSRKLRAWMKIDA